MEKKRTKKELVAVCLFVLSLVLITVGTTFAFFTYSRQGTTENTVKTGTLTFVYDEKRAEKNGVSLSNAFPMSNEEGQALEKDKNEVFDFEVRAKTQGADISYEIYLTKEEGSTLPEYAVKTYLKTLSGENESEIEGTGLPTRKNLNLYSALWDSAVPSILKNEEITNAKTLYRETITSGSEDYTKTFRYRMWIDEDANKVINGSWKYNNKTFSVKVNVYAQNETITEPTEPEVYKDESGANYPELVEGLIPVRYDTNKKSWVKADLYKEWYDYDNQEWANAVTVKETGTKTRKEYQIAKAGTAIEMDDINTMWVWIPRYEYDYISIQTIGGQKNTCKLDSLSWDCYPNPGAINIKFIDSSITSSSENNYKVHPAFDFGGEQLEGFWYGKFETSSKDACNAVDNSVNTDCDLDTLIPQIIPNVTSWRGIRIATEFIVSQKMSNQNKDKYGFVNNIDTHMSKNSEWGAVAYLSQSKYGKYEKDGEEVYINNCSSFTTGIAGATADAGQSDICTNTYETDAGQKASTTGNITGIYDMNGGSYEHVMGALTDGNGKPRSGLDATINSGFNGVLKNGDLFSDGQPLPDEKYYDLYTSSNLDSTDRNLLSTACDGSICYGHALSETVGWYGDYSSTVSSSSAWVKRGGNYDSQSLAGIFGSNIHYGCAWSWYSFRLVLASIGE